MLPGPPVAGSRNANTLLAGMLSAMPMWSSLFQVHSASPVVASISWIQASHTVAGLSWAMPRAAMSTPVRWW